MAILACYLLVVAVWGGEVQSCLFNPDMFNPDVLDLDRFLSGTNFSHVKNLVNPDPDFRSGQDLASPN